MDYSKDANIKKQKGKKSTPKKVKNRIAIIIIRILVILIILSFFAAMGACMGAYLGIIGNAPNINLLKVTPETYTSFIYDQDGNELTALHGVENREYAKISQIPKTMQDATVAIEDARFYSHNGVDFQGILRAISVNIKSILSGSSRLEGASTITQQLIKGNLFQEALTNKEQNKVIRKLQEQYLAIELEKQTIERANGNKKAAKDQLLELYLNTINYGGGAYGVQAASKLYFGKDVSELTLCESAVLAAIPQSPTKWNPKNHPENNVERRDKVLEDMKNQGYITQSQYIEAKAEDVYSEIQSVVQEVEQEISTRSYYEDQVIQEVIQDLVREKNVSKVQASNIVYNQGLKIYSCVDMEMQKILDEAYQNDDLFPRDDFAYETTYYLTVHDKNEKDKNKHINYSKVSDYLYNQEQIDQFVAETKSQYLTDNVDFVAERTETVIQPQSAFIVTDYRTGEVKAVMGGRGEKIANRVLNRATQSTRQPGSTFKVLAAYAPGIDQGILTAASVFDDAPYTKGKWSPSNWYSGYRGLSTVRKGIEYSMNIVAAKAIDKVGIDTSIDYLEKFGFTTLVTDPNEAYNDLNDTTVLGGLTRGVILSELNSAYGTIANGGEYLKPIFYTKVLDHDGQIILENNPEPQRVIESTTAFLLTDMMEDVVTGSIGTGKAAKFRNLRMPIAGKTGTTSDNKDLLFAGYTPYYAASVWLGHDQSKNLKTNGNSHLVLWRTIMEQIHSQKGLEYKAFERPEGITTRDVCNITGKLAGPLCGSHVITEYFAKGTEPTKRCYSHASIRVDTSTNMLATKYCPSEFVEVIAVGDSNADVPTEYCNVHTAETITEESSESSESNESGSTDQSDSTNTTTNTTSTTENIETTTNPNPIIGTDSNGDIIEETTIPTTATEITTEEITTMPTTITTIPSETTELTTVPTMPTTVESSQSSDIPINNERLDVPQSIDDFFSPEE